MIGFAGLFFLIFVTLFFLVCTYLVLFVIESNRIVGPYMIEGLKEFKYEIKNEYDILEDINSRRYRNLWITLEITTNSRPSDDDLMDMFKEAKEFITRESVLRELEDFNRIEIVFYFDKRKKSRSIAFSPGSDFSTWYYNDYDLNVEGKIMEKNEWD